MHGASKTVVRSLDFIPSIVRSHWEVLDREWHNYNLQFYKFLSSCYGKTDSTGLKTGEKLLRKLLQWPGQEVTVAWYLH